MDALAEFLKQKEELRQALEKAILEAAKKCPASFRAWLKALGEGPHGEA